MPKFFIETIDSAFTARDDGADYADVGQAKEAAIEAAVEIASGEVSGLNPSVTVEAIVRDENDTSVETVSVAIGVSDVHPLDEQA